MTKAEVLIAASVTVLGAAKSEETIRIGISAALTGPAAFVGVSIRRGAEMAVQA